MSKRLILIFLILFTVACQSNEPVIVKQEQTTSSTISDPELIESEVEQEADQYIEFSLPYEQVVINLKMVPILNEFLHFIDDKEKAVEKMNLLPIHLGESTIYLLEFSCQQNQCSYLVLDQSKDNPTYLIADLAKYAYTSISPDKTMMFIKFNRKTSLSLPVTDLVIIDLEHWNILPLKSQSGKEFLNYKWPINTVTWINETTLLAHIPKMDELTEDSILDWKNSGNQTAEVIFQIEN